jgi:hypothetical protein
MPPARARLHKPPAAPGAFRPRVVRCVVGVVGGLYLLAAVGAAFLVPHEPTAQPKLTPPDESAHWAFVRELATRHRLPDFRRPGVTYEAHQPPLYYLSALWTYWLAGEGGLVWARLWSALLGGLTLLVAWRASRYLLGPGLGVRLAALVALAFLPSRVFTLAAVSNDALFEPCAALVLALVLQAVSAGMERPLAAALGLSLALALLTKSSALLLVPGVVVALGFEPLARQRGWPHLLTNALLVSGPVVLLWGWWVARNLILYGEPLAMGAFQRLFLRDRATPEFFLSRGISWSGYWLLVAYQTWLSVWGVFGQATVYLPAGYYWLGNFVAGVGVVGLLVRGARWLRTRPAIPQPLARCWAVALLEVAFTLAAFLRFNCVFYQAQARYFAGVSVVGAAALAAGVYGLARHRDSLLPAVLLAAALAAMLLWALATYALGAYRLYPPLAF